MSFILEGSEVQICVGKGMLLVEVEFDEGAEVGIG